MWDTPRAFFDSENETMSVSKYFLFLLSRSDLTAYDEAWYFNAR